MEKQNLPQIGIEIVERNGEIFGFANCRMVKFGQAALVEGFLFLFEARNFFCGSIWGKASWLIF